MRILVVDDNPMMRRVLCRILRPGGADVFEAESGHKACMVIAYGKFDAVITDYEMPDINGDEVLRFTQKHSPDTRRVLVSGMGAEEPEIVRCLATQLAQAFVPKPCEPDEIMRAVTC